MAKRTTTTEVVTKAMARSGPELTPSQIRLDDSVQTDNNKVFTQSDVNQNMGSGGGGGGGAVGINEVLTEGDTADPGQSLHFKVNQGDLPPFTRDSIDIEGGSGLRLGGLASYYTINEPFTVDTDNGASEFNGSMRRMTAVDDYYFAETPRGGTISAVMGVSGISFNSDTGYFDVGCGTGVLMVGDYNAPILKIEARTYDGTSSITAGEFIGDGSKLTNLPTTGGAAASLPGRKWKLIPYSAAEKPGPGEFMYDDVSSSYYFNATDGDGIVLGNPTNVFDAYSVNGTVLVSLYKQGTGIAGIFKVAAVALKTELDKTFFHIVETNHQLLRLEEGETYNVTASGLFG